jgi:hypothetical protein
LLNPATLLPPIFCILMSATMRSSLSLKVMLAVMGFALGGPLLLRPSFEGPPPPMVRKSLGVLYALREDPSMVPSQGCSHVLRSGNIIGRFVVITAVKASRTPHAPASWAPLIGSWR